MRKIGVLRANALGDVIVSIPALSALRGAYPDAEIVLLGRKSHQELFEDREAPVNRVISLPQSLQFDRPMNLVEHEELIEELRSEAFDLLIQLHGGGRHSNRFVKLLGPKTSIGAKTEEADDLDISCPYNHFQHEGTRQLEILSHLGVPSASLRPSITFTEEDFERGGAFLESLAISGSVILLNPGAKDSRRRWPAEKFGEVAQKYIDEGHAVLVNIGPGEEDIAIRMKKSAPSCHIISPSLKDLIGLILHSKLVVSNDTGTMHLALALRRPTVSLFWFRNLIGYGPMDSTNSRVLVSWNTQCQTCGVVCCEDPCSHEESLISDIDVNSVTNAMDEFIQRSFYAGGENRSRSFDWRITGQNFYS